MWKLKLSKGDDDPSLTSVNHHIGRQFWEFDPSAGTPDQKSQLEKMRQEFTENKLNLKHSSDLLMRFQFASENRSEKEKSRLLEAKVDEEGYEDDEVIVKGALKKALKFYSTLQGDDGSWPADYGGPLFLLPGLIIGLHVMGATNAVLSAEHQREIRRYLYNHQAFVTRFSSISTRKLSKALKVLTADKTMVAMSDYNDYHRTVKRNILTAILGPNAQKKHRIHRDTMMDNISIRLHEFVKKSPEEEVDLRKIFQSELFGLALKQAMGKDVESIYVEDLGTTLKRDEIFQVLVVDPMMGAIEVDWRDFFPYLKWIPNKKFENTIQQMYIRREAVMKSLIKENKKRIASGEVFTYANYTPDIVHFF